MTSWANLQIEARAKLNDAMEEQAYAQLARSVSDPEQRASFDGDSQFDRAAKICLKYLEAEPGDIPDGVEDPDERLDWLCRPSSTMRRAVRLEKRWHRRTYGAMLAHLDTGEAVALLPRGLSGYYYTDPSTGRKVKVTDSVAQHICDKALLFYKPLPAKPLTSGDLVSFIFGVFDRHDYATVIMAALIVALVGLAPAWANKVAFGLVAPSGQVGLIAPVAALLLGATVCGALTTICRNLITESMSVKAEVVTEAAIFSRVLALPTTFFKRYSAGNLANRIGNVYALVKKTITFIFGAGLTSLFALIYVVQIAAFAPALAVPAFLIVVVQAALTVSITYAIMGYERKAKRANARLSGVVTALLNGVPKIKLAGAEKRAFARWARSFSEYAELVYNRPTALRALPALVAFVALLGNALIYYLAARTGVSVADFMAFNAAYGQVSIALVEFAAIAGQTAEIKPLMDLVAPILETAPEADDTKPSVESLDGSIEVSGVTFSYGEDGPTILRDLSFTVRPGEYVALVGKSGCGKSTILRLLLGFEVPDSGSVFYGPHDVQKVDLRSLRRHIGTVLQDGKLFMGDMASNITLSTPGATIEDAWEAAEMAGIADDIRKMPQGMQTLVSEGSGGVSGGQRQRLLIARAVCGGRRILLFDEATSALDNKTQKHVSDSLDALASTRVVVAHRLSTVRHCDRILVVDGGRIAEEGTYDELLAKGGLFTELVKRQMLDSGDSAGVTNGS
ncbi:MAG: ATP-binding cassette domain-containing protein [Eggerthellaceae bacterium]|nr:ATP-binding cassette domain-containing protein [Eggerthellaceae bacterium]